MKDQKIPAPVPNTPRIVVGSPVTGDDFFGREGEIGRFIDAIDRCAHLLVTAPRRTGKTSLLKEAARRFEDGYHWVYIDLEACESEAEAVVKLVVEARAIRGLRDLVLDSFRNVLGTLLNHIEEVSLAELSLKLHEGVEADWRAKGNEVLGRLSGADKPVVLLFDELSILVNRLLQGENSKMASERRQRVHLFLSWLREATIRHQGGLRFVVSGSIGLEPLLSQSGISETMTTFEPFDLPPWDRETALAYLQDRAAQGGIEFRGGAEGRVLDLLGHYIPQHVQMFMRFIYDQARHRSPRSCTAEDVDELYERKMLSIHGHVDLATYEDRLKRVVRPDLLGAALELLTETAVAGRLKPAAAIQIVRSHLTSAEDHVSELRFLLGLFAHDGYLEQAGSDYVFVSHLLRDWWRHRFEFGYVPVADRIPDGG